MIMLNFLGPFDLCSEANDVPDGCAEKDASGIYLWAFQVNGKYRVTYVGETGRSFYERTKKHIIQTLGGNYRVCDVTAMLQGNQEVLWDGLWRKGTRDKLPEFVKRYAELAPQIKTFLKSQKVFIAVTDCHQRLRKRIEGAIASSLRSNKTASSLLPADIRFRTRQRGETPVMIAITSEWEIEGLPDRIVV